MPEGGTGKRNIANSLLSHDKIEENKKSLTKYARKS